MSGAPSTTVRFWPVVVHGRAVGHLINRGVGGIEAFDADDQSLGLFATLAEAVAALQQQEGAS